MEIHPHLVKPPHCSTCNVVIAPNVTLSYYTRNGMQRYAQLLANRMHLQRLEKNRLPTQQLTMRFRVPKSKVLQPHCYPVPCTDNANVQHSVRSGQPAYGQASHTSPTPHSPHTSICACKDTSQFWLCLAGPFYPNCTHE